MFLVHDIVLVIGDVFLSDNPCSLLRPASDVKDYSNSFTENRVKYKKALN